MKTSRKDFAKISVSVSLLSVSLIAYQLLLIQIISIVQWYHFAYMIISVALLGFGAAGTFLSLFQKTLLEKFEMAMPLLITLTALMMSVSVWLSQTDFFYFDSYLLFNDFTHIWKLIATYLIFFLPFFFGALAIGLVFVKHIEKIGTFYFANMLGSGIGGIAAVSLMWIFLPEKLPAVISTLAFISGIMIVPKQLRSGFTFFIALFMAMLSFMYINSPELKFSEYKGISKALNLPGTKIVETESSPYGLIQIVSSPHLRYAPGLSITYPNIVSVNNASFNNGDMIGPMVTSTNDSINYFYYSTENLPFIIAERKDVLVLNSGTGRLIQQSLLHKAETITAVEHNKSLLNLLQRKYIKEADSVYSRHPVIMRNLSPRTYLLSTQTKFDLITLPIIDAFGGTSGMYALQEQYILTKEAFAEMYSKLNDDGVVCVSTWIDYPYKNPLKIIATIAEVLSERKIESPAEHIAAIKNWNTFTITVKRRPLAVDETEKIRSFCNVMKFDPVILPGIKDEERNYYNKLQDKSFYQYIDQILSSKEKREQLYSEYPFNIKPATDEKPYYSQFLQWKSISQLSESFGNQSVPFFEVGYILLYLTFFQVLLLAIILIVLPLFKLGWKGQGKLRTLIYFGGIGLGYMFIEIIFIQRFTLYFGNVIYAASAVVSLMLISSGFGALVSQKIKAQPNRIIGIIFLIVVSLIVYTIILSSLLKTTIIFTLPVKIIFTTLLIAPPAFLMGMPFPLGLRLLSRTNGSTAGGQIPWAWGINGMFSVISAVLATIIAVELGFTWVMIFAVTAYSITLIANLKRN